MLLILKALLIRLLHLEKKEWDIKKHSPHHDALGRHNLQRSRIMHAEETKVAAGSGLKELIEAMQLEAGDKVSPVSSSSNDS